MYETGRRSAISTSELGLYSDRAERYTRGKYGPVVRKFVIVVMAVVAVVLAAIFVYDFASGASATSKVSQETKRIYILQNALKKPSGGSLPKRESSGRTIAPPDPVINGTSRAEDGMQDRSDDAQHPRERQLAYVAHSETRRRSDDQRAETRSQALENFKHRKRLVESAGGEEEEEEEDDPKDEIRREVEGKQLFDNHALVYRVRQTRYKYPDPEEEFHMEEAEEEEPSRPAPFRFELKTPQPASFDKRLKFPQLAQYRYPHASRNIQDIIKYLSDDPNATKRGIKFRGVYVNPKKYDLYPEASETMANSERNEYQTDGWQQEDDYGHDEEEEEEEEEEEDDDDDDDDDDHELSQSSRYATVGSNGDPFYRYKPKHPTDVNLLAPSNVRFSPSGSQRYNPYYDPFFQRPAPLNYARPMPAEVLPQYVDNTAAHSNGNYRKRKKPKPFSVMLDIYPITDLNEQAPSNKVSRPRLPPLGIDDYDPRRPVAYTRGQRHRHPPTPLPLLQAQSIPLVAAPSAQAGLVDEDERQQMIFHLNLYPRKKNKHNRNDIIQRSESMRSEDREKLMHSVMSPFDAITKHITDHSAIEESKYEESELPETSAASSLLTESIQPQNDHSTDSTNSTNSPNDEISERDPKINFTGGNDTFSTDNKFMNSSINVDTPEGFQAFADGLLATE